MSKLKSVPKKMSLEQKLESLGLNKYADINVKILAAFSDCHDDIEGVERDLDFFGRDPLDGVQLFNTMGPIVPSYNRFKGQETIKRVVECFGEESEYFVAREGSPAIYVRPRNCGHIWLDGSRRVKGLADEFSYDVRLQMFRLWWD